MTGQAWPDLALRSPLSGRPLSRLGDGLLVVGDEIWPVIDDIPFLRVDRIEMARAAAGLLRDGDVLGATALLLTDQDGFAPDPPPSAADCAALLRHEASLSFRAAMTGLGFGRVGDYFAHRWSDPTFLSGLALLGRALPADDAPVVLELACGAGHFLAALQRAAVQTIGADVVFAKLWLARHFVSPGARLVCFSAEAAWPLAPDAARMVFCHYAFYFLPDKLGIAAQMKDLVGTGGTIAIGHAHNQAVDNHSAGAPLTVDAYEALFPGAEMFDDHELARSFVEHRAAVPADVAALAGIQAVSWLWRHDPGRDAGSDRASRFGSETSGRTLRLNPLYRQDADAARIVWPSPRYQDEYAGLASYPMRWTGADTLDPDDPHAADLLRRRIYVDLPPRW